MEQDDLRYLDGEAQQLYMAYTRRFESDDWKQIVEWADSQYTAAISQELRAKNWDDVLLARGEAKAYMSLVNLEKSILAGFESLVEQAKEMELATVESENE